MICDCVFPEEKGAPQRNCFKIMPAGRARWIAMIARCYNPERKDYKNYGGRGIKVCKKWLEEYETYARDIGAPPEGMTLDRKDNDKGYCKHNVKWATRSEQNVNRRNMKRKSDLPKGVYLMRDGGYLAQIRIDKKIYYIGFSYDLEVAKEKFRAVYFEWFGKLP